MNAIQKRREDIAAVRRVLKVNLGPIERAIKAKNPREALQKIILPELAKTLGEKVKGSLPLAKIDGATQAAIDAAIAKELAAPLITDEHVALVRDLLAKIDSTLLLYEGRLSSIERTLTKTVTSTVEKGFAPVRDQLAGIEKRIAVYESRPAEPGMRVARPS